MLRAAFRVAQSCRRRQRCGRTLSTTMPGWRKRGCPQDMCIPRLATHMFRQAALDCFREGVVGGNFVQLCEQCMCTSAPTTPCIQYLLASSVQCSLLGNFVSQAWQQGIACCTVLTLRLVNPSMPLPPIYVCGFLSCGELCTGLQSF